MSHRKSLSLVLVVAFCFPLVARVHAEVPVVAAPAARPAAAAEAPKFLRFVDDGKSGGRLETSIVTYKNADGVTVRLVSAIHIAERSYYEALNKTFEQDQAVLYELVKPKDMDGAPQKGYRSGSTIGELQRFLKDALNLSFQLDEIDYTRGNFVHADLDAETFERMQEERGESFTMLMLKAILDQMTRPQKDDGPQAGTQDMADELIKMLCRPDAERQVKLLLARHMDDVEETAAGLSGPNGSVIVTERNKACLKVLKETMTKGTNRISIFYGAAHMPSMSDSLVKEMGFRPVSTEWLPAWDLAIRTDEPSVVEKLLREGLKMLDD